MLNLKFNNSTLIIIGLILIGVIFIFIFFNEKVIQIIDNSYIKDNPNRINILIMGIRGINDQNGGLLADSIILASVDKLKGRLAIFSIPRDLYIKMPHKNYKQKINFAYALGYKEKKDGLEYAKDAISYVTGVEIDYAVAIDFDGFIKLIDILGGIDITLDKPFIEDKQWHDNPEFASSSGAFILPAGKNHLNGKMALYFVRSRFSTSDFDRAERQQKVLAAIKEKVLALNLFKDFKKIVDIFNLLKNNIRTDINFNDILTFISLANKVDTNNIKTKVFNTSPDGFLYETRLGDGTYILLPLGDSFEAIQQYVKNIFQEKDVNSLQ